MHVPLIVHWPAAIADGGGLRDEFHYVSDIVPTIYDVLGIEAPQTYRGLRPDGPDRTVDAGRAVRTAPRTTATATATATPRPSRGCSTSR